MKKALFLTAALALSLSAGGAYAQPSQAQGGGATAPTSNPPAASDATRPGSVETGGTSGTTGGAMNNPSNPPSQGKGGPTTGGSSTTTR